MTNSLIIIYIALVIEFISLAVLIGNVAPKVWREFRVKDDIWYWRVLIALGIYTFILVNIGYFFMGLYIAFLYLPDWLIPLGGVLTAFKAATIALVLYGIYNKKVEYDPKI